MSGLDPLGRALVKERLRKERSAGRTILFSSHVLSDVETPADRIGLISEGHLLVEGRPGELLCDSRAIVTIEGSGPVSEGVLSGMEGLKGFSATEAGWCLALSAPQPGQIDAALRMLLKGGGQVHRVESTREDLERFC